MISGYVKDKKFRVLNKPLAKRNSKKLVWIDVLSPTKENLKDISALYKIDYSDLWLSMDESERPRIESEKGYSFIIFNVPLYKRHVYTATLGVYVKGNTVITIHRNMLKSVSELKGGIIKSTIPDAATLVHNVLQSVVKNFDSSLDKVEDFIDIIETDVLKKIEKDYTDIVFPIKRTLIYFRKAIKYNTEVLKALHNGAIFKQGDVFEDLYEDARQLIDEEMISRERITEIVNTNYNTLSNELNKVMKSFTVIATLILLPTFITGLYGMNFKYMPELEWKYGYIFALGVMLVSVVSMLLFFKKKKWL
jgi:magnesium transporter